MTLREFIERVARAEVKAFGERQVEGRLARVLSVEEIGEQRCEQGELELMTTLTSFATALDVTLAELHLEAFLPANDETAQILREREHARRERGGATGSLPPALVVGAS